MRILISDCVVLVLSGLAVLVPMLHGFVDMRWALSRRGYRGTSLIRNCALSRPYSRTMHRALWWVLGGVPMLHGFVDMLWVVTVGGDHGELRPWLYLYVYSVESRLIMIFGLSRDGGIGDDLFTDQYMRQTGPRLGRGVPGRNRIPTSASPSTLTANTSLHPRIHALQGYLAHKKQRPPWSLQ